MGVWACVGMGGGTCWRCPLGITSFNFSVLLFANQALALLSGRLHTGRGKLELRRPGFKMQRRKHLNKVVSGQSVLSCCCLQA